MKLQVSCFSFFQLCSAERGSSLLHLKTSPEVTRALFVKNLWLTCSFMLRNETVRFCEIHDIMFRNEGVRFFHQSCDAESDTLLLQHKKLRKSDPAGSCENPMK